VTSVSNMGVILHNSKGAHSDMGNEIIIVYLRVLIAVEADFLLVTEC